MILKGKRPILKEEISLILRFFTKVSNYGPFEKAAGTDLHQQSFTKNLHRDPQTCLPCLPAGRRQAGKHRKTQSL
jgi:hypothetical protein